MENARGSDCCTTRLNQPCQRIPPFQMHPVFKLCPTSFPCSITSFLLKETEKFQYNFFPCKMSHVFQQVLENS